VVQKKKKTQRFDSHLSRWKKELRLEGMGGRWRKKEEQQKKTFRGRDLLQEETKIGARC